MTSTKNHSAEILNKTSNKFQQSYKKHLPIYQVWMKCLSNVMNINVHVQQLRQVCINISKMEWKHPITCRTNESNIQLWVY